MTWAKLDDGYSMHPKVLVAGNAAIGLHARSIAWCAEQGTDGRIPAVAARALGSSREIGRLVEVGLWEQNGDGYLVHDFLDYNPSQAEIEERRRKDSERKGRG